MSLKRTRNDEQIAERIVAMIMEEDDSHLRDYSSILQKVHEQLKNKKKKSDHTSLLTRLSGDEWLLIYSFIGVEHLFYNQIFRINNQMKENIYDNCLFWQNLFNLIWKCSIIDEKYDWIYLRKCCFHKFNSFQSQKQEKPQYISGQFKLGRIADNIHTNPYKNNIDQPCHIMQFTQPCYYLPLEVYDGTNYFAEICCTLNIYLKEKPICINLYVKGILLYDGCHSTELEIKAKIETGFDECTTNEWIQIFDDNSIPILGIIQLFKTLKLDETVLENVPSWESIKILNNFSELLIREDKHFLWFCDSILSQLPYPFEIIFRYYQHSHSDLLLAGNEQDLIADLLPVLL